MHLTKLITINWGTLKSGTFDFAPTTLLTGVTGSGKSMSQDAIQAVMTGVHAKACRFNLAQSEDEKRDTKKNYRTAEGYALGQIDQNFSRTSAHAWVVLVFEPSSALELCEPMSAVLGIKAGLDGNKPTLDRLQLYLIRGAASESSFMIASQTGSRIALPLADARSHLEGIYGGVNRVKSFGDAKGDYLQALYGWFKGRDTVSPTEAITAAKTFVKTIAFRPVKNVHELIRNEILDAEDMSDVVAQTSSIMRDIRQLRVEAERLRASITGLNLVRSTGNSARQKFLTLTTTELAQAQYRILINRQNLANATEESTSIAEEVARLQAYLAGRVESRDGVTKKLRAVEALLADIPAAGQETQLRNDLTTFEQQRTLQTARLSEAARIIAERPQHFQQLLQLLGTEPHAELALAGVRSAIEAYEPAQLTRLSGEFAKRLAAGKDMSEFQRLSSQLDTAEIALTETLVGGEASLHSALAEARGQLRVEAQELNKDIEALKNQVIALAGGAIHTPSSVRAAIELIRTTVPGANPRTLAELVEPKVGSPWIGVIENYIGANRYTIIVEAAFERDAMECLKGRHFGKGVRPKVPQIGRLLEEHRQTRPEQDSILEELEIKNPIAKAYLSANYARVLKIDTIDALRRINRGVMLDGRSAGGYAVSNGGTEPEDGCVFGVASREARLTRAQAQLVATRESLKSIEGRSHLCGVVISSIKDEKSQSLTPPLNALLSAQDSIKRTGEALAMLNLSDVQELRSTEKLINAELKELTAEDGATQIKIGEKQFEFKKQKDLIAEAERNAPEREQRYRDRLAIVERLIEVDPALDIEALQAAALAAAQTAETESTLGNRLTPERNQFLDAFREVRDALSRYNAHARPGEMIENQLGDMGSSPDPKLVFAALGTILRRTEDLIRSQEANQLAEIADRMQQAEREFNSVFTAAFVYKMLNNIDDGIKTLKSLNTRIRSLVFGRDTYEVEWSWVPQYREYYDFYRTIKERSEELDGSKTIFELELPPAMARVRDELRTLLLDDNANAADKRLAELTDWRNYRTYDIRKTRMDNGAVVMLSTWGTGSGGEAETPFYVIRAAVLSAALHHEEDADSHLSIMMLDEAFKNMDATRSRSIMEFLRNTFGFQVIVAMPTLNSGKVKTLFEREFSFAMVKAPTAGTAGVITQHRQINLKPDAISALYEQSLNLIETRTRAEYAEAAVPPLAQVVGE